MKMSTRRRPGIWWPEWAEWLIFLCIASIACQAMSSIHSVSLNVDGPLLVTNYSQNTLETVVCRVTHNTTSKSIFFYLNGDPLDGTHPLQISRTVRVSGFENCFLPQSSSQDKCDELILVMRTVPDVNNSRIFCRARSRDDDSDMRRIDSEEEVTVILKDPVPDLPETPPCSPSPSPSPSPSSSSLPPSTTSPRNSPAASPTTNPSQEPEVNTDEQRKTNTVIPEGRERYYAAFLAGETVLLIALVVVIAFLLCCLCRKNTRYNFPTEEGIRPDSPPDMEFADTKATYRPSTAPEQHTSDYDTKEPRYVDTPAAVSDV